MEPYVQGAVGVLLAMIIGITLEKNSREMLILLTVSVCCVTSVIIIRYLEPVIETIHQIHDRTGLDGSLLKVLLKVVGIGLLGEISSLICSDAGNSALGKLMQMLSSVTILWISIPLFQQLLQVVSQILGGI